MNSRRFLLLIATAVSIAVAHRAYADPYVRSDAERLEMPRELIRAPVEFLAGQVLIFENNSGGGRGARGLRRKQLMDTAVLGDDR